MPGRNFFPFLLQIGNLTRCYGYILFGHDVYIKIIRRFGNTDQPKLSSDKPKTKRTTLETKTSKQEKGAQGKTRP